MRGLTVGAGALLMALSLGSALGGEGKPGVGETGSRAPHPTLEAGKAVDGQSLYQLKLELEDQDGVPIGLDHFKGKPVLVSLFYASCPSACPMLIHDIQGIEAALDPAQLKDLRVLLVSIDPDNDTPAALKATAARFKVDESRWRLTRAPEGQLRELAAVLGIKYTRDPSGAIGHTSRLTLLDGAGLPKARIDGLNQPPGGLITALQSLAPAPEAAP